MKTTDSVMREKFEDKFGMCFQPFGEKLDEAKDFLSHSLAEARREERERIVSIVSKIPDKEWVRLTTENLFDLLTGDNPEEAKEKITY